MILKHKYKDDVLERIREAPDSLFADHGVTREEALADNDLIERLWAVYQKNVEDYDGEMSFKDVFDSVFRMPLAREIPAFSADDDTVTISETNMKVMETVDRFMSNLLMLKACAKNDDLSESIIKGFMKEAKEGLDRLATLINYKDATSSELESVTEQLRTSKKRISELETKLRASTRADALVDNLQRYTQLLTQWCCHVGFRPAGVILTGESLIADFGSEINKFPKNRKRGLGHFFIPYGLDDVDRANGSLWDYLLATDNNMKRVEDLFRRYFPKSRITKFAIEQNNLNSEVGMRKTLSFSVKIPYQDIPKMESIATD